MTGYTLTFTAIVGHVYELWFTFGATQVTATAAQVFNVGIDGTSSGIVYRRSAALVGTETYSGFWPLSGLTAASHTITLTAQTNAGTLSIPNSSLINGRMLILDVGA